VKSVFNLFYLVFLLLGIALFFLFQRGKAEVLSFYGFAESNETEINYNYPVLINEIYVTPGQEVKAGAVLLKLARIKAKETLQDENYRIAELSSEARQWTQKKKDDLAQLQQELSHRKSEINRRITELNNELSYKKSLVEGLKTISSDPSSYNPIVSEINQLKVRLQETNDEYGLAISGLESEITLGKSPYDERIKRLNASLAFDESQKIQEITVTAPSDGIVGNIFCKEAEHIPSYKTLLSFYEPHSSLVRGYVHEDLTLEVNLGNKYMVSSLKDANITYQGEVVGLGSRIVEIPMRLRKMPDLKTYGREILIQISKDNIFLQKEKVAVSNGLDK